MAYPNNDSHKTRINKFSTNHIPNYGKINHITKPLNMICLLAERLLYNHFLPLQDLISVLDPVQDPPFFSSTVLDLDLDCFPDEELHCE